MGHNGVISVIPILGIMSVIPIQVFVKLVVTTTLSKHAHV